MVPTATILSWTPRLIITHSTKPSLITAVLVMFFGTFTWTPLISVIMLDSSFVDGSVAGKVAFSDVHPEKGKLTSKIKNIQTINLFIKTSTSVVY
ncbi:hypothetical protein [Methanosarcina sp. 2.H.T.1A.15]|uniref:hypothetical protein n=1 Tax=Methanosarcina sp. 2.H.T.1A.15 TaxID=1483596 RepID=UPI001F2C1EC8|nr:hypothetical protein [Methanosarcina sp. 2.H.T.1A.15]